MDNNRKVSASCVVIRDNKVLMVKHTYGAANGKYLIPGGFCEEGELPQKSAEREVMEETGVAVVATTREILKAVLREDKQTLQKSSFVNEKFDADTWQLFL